MVVLVSIGRYIYSISIVYTVIFNFLLLFYYSMIIFMAEASTPFLNLSWLLQKQSMTKTTIFKLCAMVLILTFFVFRVILSPYMLWHMISFQTSWGANNNQLFWFNFIVVALFGLLNYYWFYKLISLAMKK